MMSTGYRDQHVGPESVPIDATSVDMAIKFLHHFSFHPLLAFHVCHLSRRVSRFRIVAIMSGLLAALAAHLQSPATMMGVVSDAIGITTTHVMA